MKDKIFFKDVSINSRFRYDRETFIKTENVVKNGMGLAWSLHNGKKYKEWAFDKDTLVVPI